MNREALITAYLDYFNNYVSVETWAEHNGLYLDEASLILKAGRIAMFRDHPDQ